MYTIIGDNECVRRTSDGAIIPIDFNNRDYQEFDKWMSAGNVAPAYVPTYTAEQITILRNRAYADPATGSDALFAIVNRLQLTGASASEVAQATLAATKRYDEIRAELPFPEGVVDA